MKIISTSERGQKEVVVKGTVRLTGAVYFEDIVSFLKNISQSLAIAARSLGLGC